MRDPSAISSETVIFRKYGNGRVVTSGGWNPQCLPAREETVLGGEVEEKREETVRTTRAVRLVPPKLARPCRRPVMTC